MTLLEDPVVSPGATGSSSGATSSVGTDGQTGAARLIASLEAEAYGTWQQAFAEAYGR